MVYELHYSSAVTIARPSWPYRLALAGVLIALTALPVLYLGIVAAFGWLVWWHISTNGWLAGGLAGLVWLYIAPAAVGVTAIVFLLKPLVPLFQHEHTPISLTRAREPRVFAALDGVCAALGATPPVAVHVDCSVNAGVLASPEFRSTHGYVLNLGLPLVAGLSTRQLVGVFAHEIAHSNQRTALRLLRTINRLDLWFARVIHSRARWERGVEDGGSIAAMVAWVGVWISERAVTALMIVSRAISGYARRQMEYAADEVQCAVVGRDTALSTLARLRHLDSATGQVSEEVRKHLSDHLLPADLAQLLIELTDAAPEPSEHSPSSVRTLTALVDTHPSDQARIGALAPTAGVLVGGDAPASTLFSEFGLLCAAATRDHYEHVLGLPLAALTVVQGGQREAVKQRRQSASHALSEFFGACFSVARPIRVRRPDRGVPAADHRLAVIGAKQEMQARAAQIERRYREYEWLADRIRTADLAEHLSATGVDTLQEFGERTTEDAQASRKWAQEQQAGFVAELAEFEAMASLRLGAAVAESASDAHEAQLLDALDHAASAIPYALEIADLTATRAELVGRWALQPGARETTQRLEALAVGIAAATRRMRTALGAATNPLAAGAPLADTSGINPDFEGAPLAAASGVVNAYFDILGAIAGMALAAEARWAAPEGPPPSTAPADRA